MRIDYVTDQFLPGEATDTIQLVTMASALGAVGAQVRLVYPVVLGADGDATRAIADYYGVSATFEAVPLPGPYPVPFGFRGLEKVMHAALATRKTDADVIYTRNLPVVISHLALSRLPVFYETYRPWPLQSRSKRVLFQALRRNARLAGLILHSELAAESYRALGFEPDRLLVAHNGIDPARFAEAVSKGAARQSLQLDGARPHAVYTGHVSPAKGVGLILDAAARLPAIDFIIVGSQGDGPIERRARIMANVTIMPWQSPADIERWLAAADVVIIPPTRGPLEKVGNTVLPIKTFQYLASGRAVVAPATRDLLEILRDGDNARLVPPDDLDAFVAALDGLVKDPEEATRIGERARAEALGNTWQARAQKVVDFITRRS